jgi:hypothetical protein
MFLAFPRPANARELLGWFRLQTWPPGFKNEVILPTVYTALTKKLRGCCASASKRIDLAFNLSGICRAIQLHPRELSREKAMNGLFHAEESSFGAKRIAMVVVGMALITLALLAGVTMALLVGAGDR